MCSFLFTNQQDFDVDEVNYLLQKRGPDYTGIHRENNYTYVHNLLSITGDFFTQPLISGSIIALFNGEIYNYKEFGNFKNDSECLVKIYQEGYLNGIDGEFAIFIHDKENEKFTFNNIERPTNFPSGFYNYKITDAEYNNLPYNVKCMIDEYGNTLKNTYLERVINNNLGVK